jgi:preprotein translocase subunit YajC
LLASIKKGDKVITNSGIMASVSKVLSDQEVVLEIADKVFVKFVKSAISSVIEQKPTGGETVPAASPQQMKALPTADDDIKQEPVKAQHALEKQPVKKRYENHARHKEKPKGVNNNEKKSRV